MGRRESTDCAQRPSWSDPRNGIGGGLTQPPHLETGERRATTIRSGDAVEQGNQGWEDDWIDIGGEG
jgi:hypothetical protein